ncbi:MAG: L-threonate dehydrogenase [Pseudomonadota bacterium]
MEKYTGVFGLGSMGMGIAHSLRKSDHNVVGFDPATVRINEYVADGGVAGDQHNIQDGMEVAVLAVLNAEQTRAVISQKLLDRLSPGACVISCATVSPGFAVEMETICNSRDIHYLDAPISGGSIKAAEGALTVMASGSSQAFAASQRTLDAISERVFNLGSAGNGSAMKAVNQLLAGTHIAAMAEAMTFGMKQGIRADVIVDVISQCAGSSWMFENRAPHIVAGDYTPHSAIDIWSKDLGIVLEIAEANDFDAPLVSTALEQFKFASALGIGGEDDAAVAKVYASRSSVDLPE